MKSKDIIFWLLLFFPCISSSLIAQNSPYIFRHITTADGLANDLVACVIQDHNGFMWIATDNGLQKYDGLAFDTYHHDPANLHSLKSDRIRILMEDHDKNILVGTDVSGFSLLNQSRGKMIDFDFIFDTITNGVLKSCNYSIQDSKGNIWFTSFKKPYLAKYDQRKGQLISYADILSEQGIDSVGQISVDTTTNDIWMATYKGVCMFNPLTGIFRSRFHNPEHLPIFNIPGQMSVIFMDDRRNVWAPTNSEKIRLFRYNVSTKQFKEYNQNDILSYGNNEIKKKGFCLISCILQDSKQNLWMGSSYDGLLKYDCKADKFAIIPTRNQESYGLHYQGIISSLYEDKENNIWVSGDKGINIFNPNWQKFFEFNLDQLNTHRAPNNEVANFLQLKNGDLWTASWGNGILIFDNQLKLKKRISDISSISNPFSYKYVWNLAWSIIEKNDGKIWAGFQHGHLLIYDPLTGESLRFQPTELNHETIQNMCEDRDHNIWLTLHTSIAKWDIQKHRFTRYSNFLPYKSENTTLISDILIDPQNNIWVATEKLGLQKFDASSGEFTEMYVYGYDSVFSISSNHVICVISLNDSVLAIGTGGGGINFFDKRTRKFKYFSTKQGLPSNYITALHFEPPYDLWATTSNGLCKIDLQHLNVYNYGLSDGIMERDFRSSVHFYKLKDGRLLAGTSSGFIYFDPDHISDKDVPPEVKITGLRIFDAPIKIDSLLSKPGSLTLSYKQNFITIQFASLSYLSPGETKYYYQLEGVDQDWVRAGNQRFATYTGLKGGTYTFNVKCVSRDGIPCPNATKFNFIIRPAWWDTWLFKMIMLILICASILALFKFRVNQIKKITDMRIKISRDLHDEIGSTLSGVSLFGVMAKNQISEDKKEEVDKVLDKIILNSGEMLSKMSDIVWAINPQNDSFERIIERLKNFALSTTSSCGVFLHFNTDNDVKVANLNMQFRKNIYLLCKEAVSNAIKYANCKNLSIDFHRKDNEISICVSDDGAGFDLKQAFEGNGLKNMRARAKEIKAKLDIKSEDGKGTLVAISFKITRKG